MQQFYKEFGRLLRHYRSQAHLSQADLAERVGLSRTSITNIELGRQNISLHWLYPLAAAIGTSPEALMPGKEFALPEGNTTTQIPRLIARELAKHELKDIDQEWITRVVRKTMVEQKGDKDEVTPGETG
ncbi:MAG: helix-turn-helix transcriptional regulator [Betaproteobacteria bacterium]